MRKSERLRQAELELVRLRMELDLIHQVIQNLLDANEARSLEAGKWYKKND